jgi:hypothetical protein
MILAESLRGIKGIETIAGKHPVLSGRDGFQGLQVLSPAARGVQAIRRCDLYRWPREHDQARSATDRPMELQDPPLI